MVKYFFNNSVIVQSSKNGWYKIIYQKKLSLIRNNSKQCNHAILNGTTYISRNYLISKSFCLKNWASGYCLAIINFYKKKVHTSSLILFKHKWFIFYAYWNIRDFHYFQNYAPSSVKNCVLFHLYFILCVSWTKKNFLTIEQLLKKSAGMGHTLRTALNKYVYYLWNKRIFHLSLQNLDCRKSTYVLFLIKYNVQFY